MHPSPYSVPAKARVVGDGERGDHYSMTKLGLGRPVVIPKKKDSQKTSFFRWEERSD
jgi:hypothetical protein